MGTPTELEVFFIAKDKGEDVANAAVALLQE